MVKNQTKQQIKLDSLDRKILYQLDYNSRQSYSQIARKLSTSKEVVIYRIKRLQSQGIIKQFVTVVDSSRLGYLNFRLFLRLQNATPEKEAEITEYLARRKEVNVLVTWEGRWNLDALITVSNTSELSKLWQEFSELYRPYIEEHMLSLYTRSRYFRRAHLLGLNRDDEKFDDFITQKDRVQIDKKDRTILEQLSADARIPLLDIAKKIGVTPKAASYRIKALQKAEVITGYRARFELELAGYRYYKIFFYMHNLDNEKIASLKAFLRYHPNVMIVTDIVGGGDFEVEVQVTSATKFREIVLDIRTKFSDIIRNLETMSALHEYKFSYLSSQ